MTKMFNMTGKLREAVQETESDDRARLKELSLKRVALGEPSYF